MSIKTQVIGSLNLETASTSIKDHIKTLIEDSELKLPTKQADAVIDELNSKGLSETRHYDVKLGRGNKTITITFGGHRKLAGTKTKKSSSNPPKASGKVVYPNLAKLKKKTETKAYMNLVNMEGASSKMYGPLAVLMETVDPTKKLPRFKAKALAKQVRKSFKIGGQNALVTAINALIDATTKELNSNGSISVDENDGSTQSTPKVTKRDTKDVDPAIKKLIKNLETNIPKGDPKRVAKLLKLLDKEGVNYKVTVSMGNPGVKKLEKYS